MHARFARSPNTGMMRWRNGLNLGCLWKATMQVAQLNAYSTKVPKLDARVTVRSEFGNAAILSCERYPKLDQKPCGKAFTVASVRAPALPKRLQTVAHPTTAEIAARVQMARCGVRLRECSRPMESGSSSSLPMA